MPSVRRATVADIPGVTKAVNDSLPTIRIRWNQPGLPNRTDAETTAKRNDPANIIYVYDNSDQANGMSVGAILEVRSHNQFQVSPGETDIKVWVIMLAVARRTAGEGIATTRTRLIAAFKALLQQFGTDMAALVTPVTIIANHPNITATDISGTIKARMDLMEGANGVHPVVRGTLLEYTLTPAQLLLGLTAV